MLGAALFLAGAMAPVTMSKAEARALVQRYPPWALREGRSSAVRIEAIVEPDGKMRDCKVVASEGSERLAAEECAALARRRLRPATDPEGRPVVGLYRTNVYRLVNPGRSESVAVRNWQPPANLTLPAGEASGARRRDADISFALFVGGDGSVTACEIVAAREERAEVSQEMMDAACREAIKLPMPTLTTVDGRPTTYVANITVRFEANPAE